MIIVLVGSAFADRWALAAELERHGHVLLGSCSSPAGLDRVAPAVEGLPAGQVGVVVADLAGALHLQAAYPAKVVTFAVIPWSWDVVETRLQAGGSSAKECAAYLDSARREAEAACRACHESVVHVSTRQAACEVTALSLGHTWRVEGEPR